MDHQIQHDIHIERARRKHTQPVRLEKHRLMQMLPRRSHRRIESLQMPRLHNPPMLAAQLQNAIRIGKVRSQRLLDQQIDARDQQRLRSRSMMYRRHTDRSRIEPPNRRQTSLNRRKARSPEPLRSLSSNSGVAIDHTNQLDSLTRLFKLTINTKMVPPEGSRSNNGNAEWLRSRH